MTRSKSRPSDWEAFLAGISRGRTTLEYGRSSNIFRQGQPADSLFYLRRGRVKLIVTSTQGKEAIVAVLGAGEFFGEGCLAGQQLRVATATAMTDCTLEKIEKSTMGRTLHEEHGASELFVRHLLSRKIRYEEDLVDQLFDSSESVWLGYSWCLLIMAKRVEPRRYFPSKSAEPGTDGRHDPVAVSHFMNKFRNLGFIDYDGDGLTVHSGLLSSPA
jgi:CRP-like cAMP-binding protein